jgi:hypothetical protein
MHAVGFLHEQNRYERDSFVRIAFQNIKPGIVKKITAKWKQIILINLINRC